MNIDNKIKLSKETLKILGFAVDNKCILTWDFFEAPCDIQNIFYSNKYEDRLIFYPKSCDNLLSHDKQKLKECDITEFSHELGTFYVIYD
jgi:hypothetical protein